MKPSDLPDPTPVPPGARVRLDDAAAQAVSADPDALKRELKRVRREIGRWQRALYAESRRALLVVLQGRDTAGKDGTIRRVLGGVTPQGLSITSFRAPSPEELAHDFLWRVHRAVPSRGMIGVFNRSHYEDVLVARVHGLVAAGVWEARYAQINAFERHLRENGVVPLKFFLHISRQEQRRRLLARLEDPEKNWKFWPGDLAERARWDDYTLAYEDAIERCGTEAAPWYVIPSDDEGVRNVLVARAVATALRAMAPAYPPADAETLRLARTLR